MINRLTYWFCRHPCLINYSVQLLPRISANYSVSIDRFCVPEADKYYTQRESLMHHVYWVMWKSVVKNIVVPIFEHKIQIPVTTFQLSSAPQTRHSRSRNWMCADWPTTLMHSSVACQPQKMLMTLGFHDASPFYQCQSLSNYDCWHFAELGRRQRLTDWLIGFVGTKIALIWHRWIRVKWYDSM